MEIGSVPAEKYAAVKEKHQVEKQKEMTNGSTEIQREVLTPFFINRDYLGCDPGTSAEYRSQWGSHVVDLLLELCYIQSGESLDDPQDFIPSLWLDSLQLLTFYVKTDWHSRRSPFSLDRGNHEETSPTSEHLFTPTPEGHWRAPGESDEYSNIIFMVAPPDMNDYYQHQFSSIKGANEDIIPYLPRHRFDMLIKFLLRWLLESLRVERTANISEIPITHTGDDLYNHWVSSIFSAGWTHQEFQEVRHHLMHSTELQEEEKNRLLRWFQFSEHSGTSYQVIPEIQETSTFCFSFTEDQNESSDQTQSNTEQSDAAEVNIDKIMETLSDIEAWVDFNSPPPVFKTNTAYMKFAVEIMNRCVYLLKLGVRASPGVETARRGYTKHRAIIVGHMVRLTKLYEGVLIHICSHHQELAHIFFRLIFETTIRMEYLITSKNKKESCRSFIFTSYRPEKDMLQDLKSKAKQQPPSPIEKRMRKSISSRLRRDRITQKKLFKNKKWDVDGKHFRAIMGTFNLDSMYAYGFGSASHQVHGDWRDLESYHLKQDGRYYTPELPFTTPDPRAACPITHACLGSLLKYLKWSKSDPNDIIKPIVEKLIGLNRALDEAHENSLGE